MKIMLNAIKWHVQNNQRIRPRQHGFVKGRFCLTCLISFHVKVIHLVDKGKIKCVIYLNFSKDFTIVSQCLLQEKLFMSVYGLDECVLH